MNFDLTHALEILGRTPSVLRALLADLSEEWAHQNEGRETWSPFDVVGHLIDGEEADWMVRARMILATWVAHDLGHLAQIARVMAKQYRDAVGPWEAYLPVLHG